jgi:sec-independent protein translocase protein TatB
MLDLGLSELLIIGVVALIVVGPKDLPKMLRTLGQYAGRAKSIAREFQRSMDDAARQADIDELHEVKKGLDDMRDAQHKMQRDLSQSFLDGPSKPTEK